MRIGFFTDSYLPKTYGTELSIENFRQHLEKLGHQVFVFCPSYDNAKSTEKIWRLKSIKIRSKPIEERFLIWNGEIIKRILDLKLDIVHAHIPFTAGWLAKIIAKKANIPLIYSSHMLYPEYAKFWIIKNNKILPAVMRWYLQFYGNRCDGVIAPSVKMKKLLEGYGIKKQIFVLPTGLDLEKLSQVEKPEPDFKNKLHVPPNNKIIFYVGRLTQEKNVFFLIDSFIELAKKEKNVSFILAGDGPLKEKLIEKVKNANLENQIIFLGQIPWNEVLKIYQIANIFVFASLTDTQGLVFGEADYFGVPVVALKDECYEGIMTNNKNGYTVYPYEPSLFAEKILNLIKNDILWKQFSENGKIIAQKFSAENQTKKLIEIYKELITDHHEINR